MPSVRVSTMEKQEEYILERRISEHIGAVKRHNVKNDITVHAWTKQHRWTGRQ